jgi:CheY-like chemotaxis protein
MKAMNILVVDDDLDLAGAIGEALELAGHNPTLAVSGSEAVEKYRQHRFDITFMDVKLPDINGVEALMAIREMDATAHVVMMTGYRIDQLLAQATENGAVKVLHKPFAMEAVIGALEEVRPNGMVLIADDDADFADSTKNLLQAEGYRVLVARTGREAVEQATATKFDVLVLDLRLPVMHGVEVYLELKKRGRTVPTIIVTGYAEDEADSIDTLKSLSVTGCLFKPFEPEQLIQAVDSISRQARAQ